MGRHLMRAVAGSVSASRLHLDYSDHWVQGFRSWSFGNISIDINVVLLCVNACYVASLMNGCIAIICHKCLSVPS